MSLLGRLGLRSRNGDAPTNGATTETRRERAERAAKLRAQGLTVREVGLELGISRSYASSLLLDPDGAKDKARKASYGRECVDCGTRTTGSDGPNNAPKRCLRCTARLSHENRYWNQDRVLAAIQRFAAEHGRPPTAMEWLKGSHGQNGDGYPYTTTVQREFGSWADAIEAAGFPRPLTGHHQSERGGHRVSTEALIQRIRDASEIVVLAPRSSDSRMASTYVTLHKRGISWAEACEMAGVSSRRAEGK